jgi:hypothetical protein
LFKITVVNRRFHPFAPFIRPCPDTEPGFPQNGALLIAACIVAAIRLRGEPIQQSPKVVATVSDSIKLARMVLREIER